MQPSGHSLFEPGRHSAPPPRRERDDRGLAALRAAVAHSRTRFVVVSTVGWAATVGLPPLVGIPTGIAVAGEVTLGMVLFAAQAGLLLTMSVYFDRAQRTAYREWRDSRDVTSHSVGRGGGR
ncbi:MULTISPECIES: hypothetical protein [unclassified Streptomyces]|uniref:hypothetical protein n=1 Tax=unclassified Streptomyces TaxID=2593676 RepID=UPI0035DC856A